MTTAYVALGSNVGDRRSHLVFALERLSAMRATGLLAASALLETEPEGPIPQGRYLNAAAALKTDLPARELLNELLDIERARGRNRRLEQRWGPRTLDLDLLLYGEQVIDEPGLTVPHPRLHVRRFVLEPLAQIAADAPVPGLARTVGELLVALNRPGSAAIQGAP